MRRSVLLLSLVAVAPSVAYGQSRTPHRWLQILAMPGAVVDVDTANVQRRDSSVVAWLRWNLDRGHPMGVEYRVEQVELDCRALKVRLLTVENVEADNTVKVTPVPLDSSDTKWRQYSKGSLGAESVQAACRRLTRA